MNSELQIYENKDGNIKIDVSLGYANFFKRIRKRY